MQKNRILLSLGLLAALSVGLIWFGLSQEVSPDSNAAPVSQAVPPTPVSQEDTPDPADWRLCLVNPWHPLPEGYQPQLTQVENGHQVDSRCAADLEAMLADCRAAGHAPLLCSSYRTQEKQTQLYNNLVQKQIARGNSRSEAMAKAAKEVAVPGTSEHQLGLAVDIVDTQNQVLNRAQEDTAVQQWLMEHCWEYGFILRYPPDKGRRRGLFTSPGITGMSGGNMPRPSGNPVCVWKSFSRGSGFPWSKKGPPGVPARGPLSPSIRGRTA